VSPLSRSQVAGRPSLPVGPLGAYTCLGHDPFQASAMTTGPSPAEPLFRNLRPGDPAPWFRQRSTSNPAYAFDTVAGRYVVLCFFGTAGDEQGRSALAAAQTNRDLFDDEKACFFGVSVDPADRDSGRVREMLPGLRHFWDFDGLLEPFRKEVESVESVVILWLAPESRRGAICGSRSIVRLRIGADYATRAI
jgi:hypothetical protein